MLVHTETTELERTIPPSSSNRRLRVLVSAYVASPLRGSEPAVGWQIPIRLAQHHDIILMYASDNGHVDQRHSNEQWLAEHEQIPGFTLFPVDQPPIARFWFRVHDLGFWPAYYWAYKAWQRQAARQARHLSESAPFDIHHQLNMIGFREPGYLWTLPGRFVWGPVGGAANTGWSYLTAMSLRGRVFFVFRNLINRWQRAFPGRSRRAGLRASHVWAVDREAQAMMKTWGVPSELQLESGTIPQPSTRVRTRDTSRRLKVTWSGLHIARKQLPILLEALARLPAQEQPELTVLGSGPETESWKQLAVKLGVTEIQWTGQLAHAEALAVMQQSDVFVLTSVQEGTPHVILEALSFGIPVICHDTCGMGTAVTEKCGIKVEARGLEYSITAFAEALHRLCENTTLLEQLSRGALLRAQQLTWSSIAATMAAQYNRVMEAHD